MSSFVNGWIRISLKVAGRLIPSLFQPRILGVGLLVGEQSEIGIDPHIDARTLESAFTMAFDALLTLAAELKSVKSEIDRQVQGATPTIGSQPEPSTPTTEEKEQAS